MSPPVDRTTNPTPWAVGDGVWVHAYGKWRRGRVVAVGLKTPRVRVNYSKRSTDDSRGEQWFGDRDGYPVLRGSLDEPVRTSCWACRLKLVDGRPGELEEAVIGRHQQRSPSCMSAAEDEVCVSPSANGCDPDVPVASAAGPGASSSPAPGPAVVPPSARRVWPTGVGGWGGSLFVVSSWPGGPAAVTPTEDSDG